MRIAAARAALGCIDPHRSPRLPRTSLLASPRDIRPVPEGAARHEHSAHRILEGDARLTPCCGALTRRAACRCGSGRRGCRRCRACRGCASRRCRLRRTTTPTSTWTSSAPSPTCGPGTTPSRKSMLSRCSAQSPFSRAARAQTRRVCSCLDLAQLADQPTGPWRPMRPLNDGTSRAGYHATRFCGSLSANGIVTAAGAAQAKLIAGRIIPALATTTSMVARPPPRRDERCGVASSYLAARPAASP